MPGSVRPHSAAQSVSRRSAGSVSRPLTARTRTHSQTSLGSTHSIGVVGQKIRPSTATPQTNIHGHAFYKCPRSGALKFSYPKYTIPRCKSKSFLDGVEKKAKRLPAPNSYKLGLSWKGKNAQIKGTKRITFTDEIREQKKKLPAPNSYKNLDKLRKKIPNGKFDQTKDIHFLSEAQFLSKTQPGPTKYENKKLNVMARNPAWKWSNPK